MITYRPLTTKSLVDQESAVLDIVLSRSAEAIMLFDSELICTYANPAAGKILGSGAENIIHKRADQVLPLKNAQLLNERMLRIMKLGTAESYATVLGSAEKPISVEYSLSPIGDQAGCVLIARNVTERTQAEETIRKLAFYDQLTGLPNRFSLERTLNTDIEQRGGENIAVLIIDVDRFKNINDVAGYTVGDAVLRALTERLQNFFSEEIICLGRLGGDEFVLILKSATPSSVASHCRKLLPYLSRPIQVGIQQFSLTVSIGAAITSRKQSSEHALLKNAEVALYESKSQGRNCFRLHTEQLGQRTARTLSLGNALHTAIEQNQFEVHYQPIVNCQTGKITKAEALIRWNHPTFGIVSPSDFIPLSEESDEIYRIGIWIIGTVAGQIQRWQSVGITTPKVAVNLSPRQFSQSNLLEMIDGAIIKNGLAPECLELEVTESAAIQENELTISRLQELRRMGIKTAIDDFGSGYASLSYLRRLPIDTIKIDKLFIQDCAINKQDAAIIRAIIDLAHSLKLKVVAEGIENKEQFSTLCSLGCDAVQGYLFSQPVPADEFAELLRKDVTY